MSIDLKSSSVQQIANLLDAEVFFADQAIQFTGVASLEEAGPSDIAIYYGQDKHQEAFLKTNACACIVNLSLYQSKLQKLLSDAQKKLCIFGVKDPNLALAKLMSFFYPEPSIQPEISQQAYIASSATIGKGCSVMFGSYIGANAKIGNNVRIYPQAFIGNDVIIGDNCVVHHAASVMNAVLGNNVIINAGARVGKDGFRYVTDEKGNHIKVPHRGRVLIGNDVEVGANSTIDRGVLVDTIIGDMCKLDNLVQIGHNVILGKGCFLVSQVGIAGSSKLGNYVALGGQVGIADHITIGDGAKVAAQSGIISDVPVGAVVVGFPAQPVRDYFKQVAILKKLGKEKKHG